MLKEIVVIETFYALRKKIMVLRVSYVLIFVWLLIREGLLTRAQKGTKILGNFVLVQELTIIRIILFFIWHFIGFARCIKS